MTPLRSRPEAYALAAAFLNGTIGPLNRMGFLEGATHHQLAFFKCFIAFLGLFAFCMVQPARRSHVKTLASKTPQFMILAFLGVFSLYFFETWAFKEASIPLVSFLTYAAGGVTILLSAVFLGERVGTYRLVAFAAILAGIYLIYSYESGVSGSPLGVALALLGGLGYALFIFAAKLLRMEGGLAPLVWLFGFGSLYLAVPAALDGISLPTFDVILVVLALVACPTIGGFYCTTKAVHGARASSVQIIETSDPLFAAFFAFALFGDRLTLIGWGGAALIMLGLLVALKDASRSRASEGATNEAASAL